MMGYLKQTLFLLTSPSCSIKMWHKKDTHMHKAQRESKMERILQISKLLCKMLQSSEFRKLLGRWLHILSMRRQHFSSNHRENSRMYYAWKHKWHMFACSEMNFKGGKDRMNGDGVQDENNFAIHLNKRMTIFQIYRVPQKESVTVPSLKAVSLTRTQLCHSIITWKMNW